MSTARLVLRPLEPGDAPELARQAGHPDIESTSLHLPALPGETAAAAFIEDQAVFFNEHRDAAFAVAETDSATLCGCVRIECDYPNRNAELNYWIAPAFQGRGYATEAVRCLIAFSFGYFRINRIHARHFASHPASGRVLQKAGLRQERCQREHLFKPGRGFEDVAEYGILLREWAEIAHQPPA